ncbi:MAG: outer membrane protein assembly factor BamA [Spirochaetaceae bacterium]|jgi:outer membrane protein insertion porin family|nr:outer membrane protein assembly factor BamA [Spirochaetaceae bacterium]
MRFGLAAVLIIGLIFPCFSQQTEEWYQNKPIKDIAFEGLRHVKLPDLEEVINPYIGRSFNDDLFWELQGKLYALEYFETITPSAIPSDLGGSEVIIKFVVRERPVVSRIIFTGNQSITRSSLQSVISIKVNDVVNQAKLRVDELAVSTMYLEKGFPDIAVRSELVPNGDGTIALTFYVTEGEKITIESLDFEGNTAFSTAALRGQLSLKRKGIMADGAFQEAKLLEDVNAITQYYRDRGYIDAGITDVIRNVQKDEKGENRLTIIFRVYEGRMYKFNGVTFEGNVIFSTEQLSVLIRSKPGETMNARRVETDLQRVADLYYENGYIFNTLTREETRNTEEGLVSYHIAIIERSRAHIERVLVRGNEKTREEVILREIPLEPGDVFSKTKVMDGVRNLYNLQYFSQVIPDTPQGSAESLMDLVFSVEEQPTTDIQLGVTFSGTVDPGTFPISGQVKWNDRNFLGRGNIIGAGVTVSPDTQSLSLEYTQRWLLGLPLSGGFDFTFQHAKRLAAMDKLDPVFNGDEAYAFPDGFDSYTEYERNNKLPPNAYLMNYNQWNFSLGFSTGYRFLTPVGNLGLSGGIRSALVYNSYDADLLRPFDPTLRSGNNRWVPAESVWTSISLDQRDIYYDPSQGYYGIQRFGIYGIFPFEVEHYIKSDTKLEYFHTLFNIQLLENYSLKAVLGLHTGLSFIFQQPLYDHAIVEDANKLLVDGMFVGRGWTDQRLNRGLALWENWAEVRFPVVPNILALDLFFDAAAVKETPKTFFSEFKLDDMRFSFGGGLRFAIPQFPFRFIFAKRFMFNNGAFTWIPGSLGGNASNPASGIDFVISFALSTY